MMWSCLFVFGTMCVCEVHLQRFGMENWISEPQYSLLLQEAAGKAQEAAAGKARGAAAGMARVAEAGMARVAAEGTAPGAAAAGTKAGTVGDCMQGR